MHAHYGSSFVPRKGTELEKAQRSLEDRWRGLEEERDVRRAIPR
jgi:hypothetical protein